MNEAKTTDKIVFRLVPTPFFTRWPCHICGGVTDKDSILCEAVSPFSDPGTLRICVPCLQRRGFDDQLLRHATALECQAAAVRSLIGQIEAPSFAEWEQAMADDNAEQDASDVTIDDLRTRYVDQSNWRRNEQGFPYIEIAGRVIALYPWTDGWTWMIYRGGPEPLAWLVDPARLYAEGVSADESAARDEAWKAFRADLEKLQEPIPDDWF